MKKRSVLITDAARSPEEEYRHRQVRYVTMMGLRALCILLGAILVGVHPPLLPLWLILCAAGGVLLPWAAVLIANDRPPKTKAERAASRFQDPVQPALSEHSAEEREHLTIDLEPEPEREHRTL